FKAGNQVLIEIAGRWKAISDKGGSDSVDYLTRINGDEFLLIICGYDSDETLRKVIGQYADALADHLTIDGSDIYITASFGYAEYPTDAGTADSLLSYANLAMNEIKRANSSDHILKYSSEIIKNERTLEIENIIRKALKKETIYFNLQPQYDMEHRLRGFEALARMKDSEGNFISPGEFIPVAEKVGLIDKVDSMVFKKATAFFSSLIRKTGLDLTLSLNASARHLMKSGFIEEIRDLLDKNDIVPHQLEVEITESILIDSPDKALHCVNELKEMGIKLAIDDFGTGYSSLSYLSKIPANLLKIDKSFIDKINTNENSKQYVAAMISMGHIMGLDVISEGVEEDEQLDALRSIGCDYVQGFIWGRPMSAEDAEKLVSDMKL
ncbi:MAG: bifunctional diguanylate cyclase/phosphodiesterase, partial [Ruminococcus sp.]|nr:bifunctional diguanylate cyclase/phosphodiesterase [Ruminococcus sp.]